MHTRLSAQNITVERRKQTFWIFLSFSAAVVISPAGLAVIRDSSGNSTGFQKHVADPSSFVMWQWGKVLFTWRKILSFLFLFFNFC